MLWLAKRRVCMRVCKHGCDIKVFCFSHANHVSTNWKSFELNIQQVYVIYPFAHWLKLGKSLQKCCVNVFLLKLTKFWARKICILESIFFAKQELIMRARLSVQDFATSENFSFNQCQGLGQFSTSSWVCITVLNSPNLSCVYFRLCKHWKRFLLLK